MTGGEPVHQRRHHRPAGAGSGQCYAESQAEPALEPRDEGGADGHRRQAGIGAAHEGEDREKLPLRPEEPGFERRQRETAGRHGERAVNHSRARAEPVGQPPDCEAGHDIRQPETRDHA